MWELKGTLTIREVKATKSVEIKSLLNQVNTAFEQIKICKALYDWISI